MITGLSVKTTITFAEDDFDRLLNLSYPDGLRMIAPKSEVHRAKSISLEVVPGTALLRMSYYPVNADGSPGKSIRFWHLELPQRPGHHDQWLRLVVGDSATPALVAALATLWEQS